MCIFSLKQTLLLFVFLEKGLYKYSSARKFFPGVNGENKQLQSILVHINNEYFNEIISKSVQTQYDY